MSHVPMFVSILSVMTVRPIASLSWHHITHLIMEIFTTITPEIRLLKIIARSEHPRWEQFILLINDGYQASFVAGSQITRRWSVKRNWFAKKLLRVVGGLSDKNTCCKKDVIVVMVLTLASASWDVTSHNATVMMESPNWCMTHHLPSTTQLGLSFPGRWLRHWDGGGHQHGSLL